MSDRYELFLTCPKGLEGLLAEEATALGLEDTREHTSAIRGCLPAVPVVPPRQSRAAGAQALPDEGRRRPVSRRARR